MEPKYKVRRYMDDYYEVYDENNQIHLFHGNLCECDAWIRLTINGRF